MFYLYPDLDAFKVYVGYITEARAWSHQVIEVICLSTDVTCGLVAVNRFD